MHNCHLSCPPSEYKLPGRPIDFRYFGVNIAPRGPKRGVRWGLIGGCHLKNYFGLSNVTINGNTSRNPKVELKNHWNVKQAISDPGYTWVQHSVKTYKSNRVRWASGNLYDGLANIQAIHNHIGFNKEFPLQIPLIGGKMAILGAKLVSFLPNFLITPDWTQDFW